MILVDSSVWIRFFASKPTELGKRLYDLIAQDIAIVTIPPIRQEVCQGAANEQEFRTLNQKLSFTKLILPSTQDYVEAAYLYARCRWKGITPRSGIDCLIAHIAVQHSLPLLHADRDFESIAKVLPSLRFA